MLLLLAAQTLARQYQKAQKEFPALMAEYNEMRKSIDSAQLTIWEADERHALVNRAQDPSVMDIYDVQTARGTLSPSLSPNRLFTLGIF